MENNTRQFQEITNETEIVAKCLLHKHNNNLEVAIQSYYSLSPELLERDIERFKQDEEFNESLRIDRERDANLLKAKQDIEKAKQDMLQAKRNEEIQQQKEQKAKEKKQEDYKKIVKIKESKLENHKNTEDLQDKSELVRIAIRYPNGQMMQRFFNKKDRLSKLIDFVEVKSNFEIPVRFSIINTSLNINIDSQMKNKNTFLKNCGFIEDTCVFFSQT